MSKGFKEVWIEGLQCLAALEDQVRCVLRLHEAPVKVEFQVCDHRAVLLSERIQTQMQDFRIELVCQLIGERIISDLDKSIIQHFVSDAALFQLVCQPVVTVEIELQPKWTPSGYSQIAQSQLLIDEVEIVRHTLAAIDLQKKNWKKWRSWAGQNGGNVTS